VPLLVDGDNLLGTWPGRKRSDAERRSLAFELSRFAQRTRRRVRVVFDGTGPPGEGPGTDVKFAGPSSTADDLILAFLRQQSDPRGWTVVTSDRSLGDQCRYLKATVLRSDRFRKQLTADPATEKPERESDVAYWLDQFGSPPED
jgi:predicted RNA-binding protein with PIN domain